MFGGRGSYNPGQEGRRRWSSHGLVRRVLDGLDAFISAFGGSLRNRDLCGDNCNTFLTRWAVFLTRAVVLDFGYSSLLTG